MHQRGLAAVTAGKNFGSLVDLLAGGELGGAPQAGVAQLWIEALEREAADDLVFEQTRVDGVCRLIGNENKLVEAWRRGEEQLCASP